MLANVPFLKHIIKQIGHQFWPPGPFRTAFELKSCTAYSTKSAGCDCANGKCPQLAKASKQTSFLFFGIWQNQKFKNGKSGGLYSFQFSNTMHRLLEGISRHPQQFFCWAAIITGRRLSFQLGVKPQRATCRTTMLEFAPYAILGFPFSAKLYFWNM